MFCLSPPHEAETVKPAASLSCQDRAIHFFDVQSLNLAKSARHAAHVGRAAEDDGIGGIELGLAGLRLAGRDQGRLDARDALGARGNGLGDGLGVAVAGVIDDATVVMISLQS